MSVAFIIPIYPKHYHYMYNVINTLIENEIKLDIFLVFSHIYDYEHFQKKDAIKSIIIPPVHSDNLVTFKKFAALQYLTNNSSYDYFIVCDAEIQLIPQNCNSLNILNKIKKIFEHKKIYALESDYQTNQNITKDSSDIIQVPHNLKELTDKYKLYYWWNDLPVYKREHLPDFFSKLNPNINLSWCHFDHKIYLNYLILFHNFTIINLTSLLGYKDAMEYHIYTNDDFNKLKTVQYGFSYISPRCYKAHTDTLIQEGTFLIYNIDRV